MPLYLKRYDEPGHTHLWTISCYRRLTFFWHDDIKRTIIEALRRLQGDFNVCLVGYVIMPEHVHVLVYPHARGCDKPTPISTLLHAFKQHVGYHAKQALRAYWQTHGRLWSEPLTQWACGTFDKRSVWNKRGHDFNIHERKPLIQKLDYCHKNPITRGLVERPEQWAWSSYRFYELDDTSVLAMDWDGRWPIIW